MKTAMQEFFMVLKEFNKELYNTMYNEGILDTALEKEKEQILDARLDGFVISGEGWNGEYPFEGKTYEEISSKINNEEYYMITYNQNK